MSRAPSLCAPVLLAALLFLPTPIIAARPALAGFLDSEILGVPAAVLVIPAYMLLFVLLARSFARLGAKAGE